MLQQALHIFKKDARHLRYEIAGVLAMVVLFIAADAGRVIPRGFSQILQILLPVTWCFLIARAVHGEPIPGDRQFWITRPYSRASLVLAKAIFILVVVNLPLLAAQAAILVIDRFPLASNLGALLWEQVLITTVVSLPALVFAAMTANMIQFLAVAGLPAALGFALLTPLQNLGAVQWIAYSVAVVVILAVGSMVLWLQYRLRKTVVSLALTASGVLFGLGLVMLNPGNAAFAIQSRLSGPLQSPVQVELQPAVSPSSRGSLLPRGSTVIALPLRVTGLPEGVTLRCEGAELTIHAPSGETWSGQTSFDAPFQQNADGCVGRRSIHPIFLEKNRDQPVRIHGTLSLTVFGNPRSTNLLPEGPTTVPGVGQCVVQPRELEMPKDRDVRPFVCAAALRWPRLLITGHAVDRTAGETFGIDLSYSPFPAEFMISPIQTNLGLVAAEAITITTREPLAHLRVEFEAKEIRLGNLELPTAR
jgi:hypothetical protein